MNNLSKLLKPNYLELYLAFNRQDEFNLQRRSITRRIEDTNTLLDFNSTQENNFPKHSLTNPIASSALENDWLQQVKEMIPCWLSICQLVRSYGEETSPGSLVNQPSPRSLSPETSKINQFNPQEFTIRAARQKDLSGLAEVLVYGFYQFPQFLSWLYPPLKLSIYEDLRNRLRACPPNYCCLVASLVPPGKQPIIVGTVEMSLRYTSFWSSNSQYPYISNLAVDRCYRRRGIAQKLLASCEQIALEWGYQETRLHVLEENYPAKQLYFQRGYQIYQQEDSWHKLLFNSSQRLLLSKQL